MTAWRRAGRTPPPSRASAWRWRCDPARAVTRLADATWPSIVERPLLVVPLGAVEQHGPHLPLDVDVYDTVGLASPLAAHTDRMEDGRIGHDKFLPYDWVLARTGVVEDPVNFPRWIDVNWVNQAEVGAL